jgi:hypothetical protein
MGKLNIAGIVFDNPQQVDQSTLNWQPGLTLTAQPTEAPVGFGYGYKAAPGGIGYGWMAIPKPGSFDANPPTANPVLFGKQPPSLSAGGIQIPNSSVVFKSPA